jgi:AraC family transcriptional regulator, transcriptional activator FtrA
MLRNVAVVVSEPVPAFELGVASEIFGLPRLDPSLPRYHYAVCAEERRPMRTTTGFTVVPTHSLRRLAAADLVLVTGAAPPVPPPTPGLTAALRSALRRGATVASVCTGAFALAGAGVLDGRRATTHWMYTDELARRHPAITVEPDRLYVQDGPVATSAGSSAAIDLCLQLLRDAHGAEIANRVARELVVPAHRSGGQAQYTQTPVDEHRLPGRAAFSALLEWAVAHLDGDLSVDALAAHAAMSPRTFVRRFAEATGSTPAAWVRTQRLLQAERLLEGGDGTLEAIARRCGFGSADTLRRQFLRVRGVPPDHYRRAFRSS